MDRYNQSLNSHMLSFDPVYRPEVKIPPEAQSDPFKGMTRNPNFKAEPYVRGLEGGGAEVALFAPDAKKVTMTVPEIKDAFIFTPGEDGYWRCVAKGISPGFHYVFFEVDGVKVLHPYLPVGYGYGRAVNYIDLPGDEFEFCQLKDVPHGALTMEIYKSSLNGRFRNCWVYTPPSYARGNGRYPVLYIQHGGGEDESGWFWQGKLHYILDNLIAEGKCGEMIAVTNAGNAYLETAPDEFTDADAQRIITEDCVPFIDGKYRTVADAHNRAIAGLSMGGGQARHMAHGSPEVFANLAVMSSGQGFLIKGETQGVVFDYSELFSSPERYNSVMDVTFISCGLDDMRHEYTSKHVTEVAEQGFNVEYKTHPGGHEWNVWRLAARDFATRIFRK